MNRHDIYSKVQPGLLCHSVIFGLPAAVGRFDISRPEDALQLAIIHAEPGHVFKAHYHIPKEAPPQHVTQESWDLQMGLVFARYFDIDGSYLEEIAITANDTAMTFAGGHEYRIGQQGAIVKEHKSGPYWGQALDKVWL